MEIFKKVLNTLVALLYILVIGAGQYLLCAHTVGFVVLYLEYSGVRGSGWGLFGIIPSLIGIIGLAVIVLQSLLWRHLLYKLCEDNHVGILTAHIVYIIIGIATTIIMMIAIWGDSESFIQKMIYSGCILLAVALTFGPLLLPKDCGDFDF